MIGLPPFDARGACDVWRSCGGCPHIEADPRTIRERTVRQLEALFEDQGCRPHVWEVCRERSPIAYRNRIRLRVNDQGRLAFFNAAKSARCAVLDPPLLHFVQKLVSALGGEPWLREVAHVELRTCDLDGRFGLCLTPKNAHPGPGADEDEVSAAFRSMGLDGRVVAARSDQLFMPAQKFPLTKNVYQWVPLDGFMQVNTAINQALIQWLLASAQAHAVTTVLDLYCGSGNFLLPLLADGKRGLGVEVRASSVMAAQRAAHEQSLPAHSFVQAEVGEWLRAHARAYDLLIVDAPRAGLGARVEQLRGVEAKHIALVSCHPKTLVRDVAELRSAGYRPQFLRVFDMFAYTDHVEVGVWLSR